MNDDIMHLWELPDVDKYVKGFLEVLMYAIPAGVMMKVGYDTPKEQATLRNALIFGGAGLTSYGLYRYISRKTKEQESDPPKPEKDKFSCQIVEPVGGDKWSKWWWHKVVVNVRNLNDRTIGPLYVGMTMKDPNGTYHDFTPVHELYLSAQELATRYWDIPIIGTPGGLPSIEGKWEIKCALWDVLPQGDCETQGTCHRLADSGWIVVEIGDFPW